MTILTGVKYMNKFTVKFELIDGDAISEEWETEKSLKELNQHIAQLLIISHWYTIIDVQNNATTINHSHVKYYTITGK